MSNPRSWEMVRVTPFQNAPFACHQTAASVWSAVRVVLVTEPICLTSLKSLAYAPLVSAFGPSVRSISALGTMNGVTPPIHAAGSGAKFGGVGRQTPGPAGRRTGDDPPRPSFLRASSIACAAAAPTAIPAAFEPTGSSGKDAIYES